MLSSYNQSGFVPGDRFDYSSKRLSRKASAFIFASIVVAHGVLIIIVLNSKLKQREDKATESLLQLIPLTPEKYSSLIEYEKPLVIFQLNRIYSKLPDLDIKDVPAKTADLSNYQSSVPYELPNKNDELYRDVFDPRLRKKLQEAHSHKRPKKQEALNSWTTSGGATFADMGDGQCIASMPKTDSHERGTSWSMLRVKCGKTDSEKMMDSVNADLEARKHPLDVQ